MANHISIFKIIMGILIVIGVLFPHQVPVEAHHLKRSKIYALKKVALAATVLGNRKKIMVPLPVPLPLPIPIIHKREPIISPIDPLLTLTAAKGAKGYYNLPGGYGK